MRLDLGLTSPHQVGTLAGTSSYGNLAVFNPRHDSLAAGAAADADLPGSRRAFKSRQAVHAGGDRNCLHAMEGAHTAAAALPLKLLSSSMWGIQFILQEQASSACRG